MKNTLILIMLAALSTKVDIDKFVYIYFFYFNRVAILFKIFEMLPSLNGYSKEF